jgi:DNA-binding response OmpR family regulator
MWSSNKGGNMDQEKRILFVEDDTDTCELMQMLLKDADVTCVFSFDHALLKIESDPSFDLFLLDYYLPDATGLELCEAIRKRDAKTPIVFLSGSGWLSNKDVRESGGQCLIRKASPDFLDDVKQTVDELLSSKPEKRMAWKAH